MFMYSLSLAIIFLLIYYVTVLRHYCLMNVFVSKKSKSSITNPKSTPSPFSLLFVTQSTDLGMILSVGTYV